MMKMNKVNEYLETHKARHLEELKQLLEIPSISAQSEHLKDIRKAGEWLVDHLSSIGMDNAKLMETAGHPVVYADWLHAKNATTVLIYGHYDVQAADPLEEWETPPFEPTEKNGNLYARGTADDKGQLFTHIKAIEAIMAIDGKLPVNVKFMLEGEEEIASANLDAFIQNNKEFLDADVCLISDSHSLSTTQPLIDYGLRGIVYAQVEIKALNKDVHSGSYGGNVPNPANILADIISKLKNSKTHKITIPGFYDKVREPSKKELKELEESFFNEESIKSETGASEAIGVEGQSVAERAGARPTLDVNGMVSGYIGEGPKTIIPAKASAKISMRLVPHQTAAEIEEMFENYVKEMAPDYVDFEVKFLGSGDPILMNRNSKYFKAAEKAFETVFGNLPIYEMNGGSIPVTATLKDLLQIDSVLMGFGLPDDRLHAPNEKMNLEMFYKGIKASAVFFKEFE